MPKHMLTWGAMLTALTVLLCGGLATADSPDAPNVAQVDLQQAFQCPTGGQSAEIPDLKLRVQTLGNPVMVMFILNFQASPFGAHTMRPVIDGQSLVGDQLGQAIGDFPNSGQIIILPFTRLYSLPAGLHTFGIDMSCQSSVSVVNGWMTVYELPSAKLK